MMLEPRERISAQTIANRIYLPSTTIHILRIELVAFLSLLVRQREFYQLVLKTLGYS